MSGVSFFISILVDSNQNDNEIFVISYYKLIKKISQQKWLGYFIVILVKECQPSRLV